MNTVCHREKRSDPSRSLWGSFSAIQLEFRWIVTPSRRAGRLAMTRREFTRSAPIQFN